MRDKKRITIFLLVLFSLFKLTGFGQLSVANYSGCPNQIVTVTATWPNVAITSLSLSIPGGSGPLGNFLSPTFTMSHPGPGCPLTFTLYGTGLQNGLPINQQATFNYCVVPPPPLVIAGSGDYCFGQTAQLIAPNGGTCYTLNGPGNLAIPCNAPVFNIGPLTAGNTGTYLITSISGCTATGIATINVAPNSQITVGQTTNVCQGQSFVLTANLPGAQAGSYNWIHPILGPYAAVPNTTVGPSVPNQGGVWTVTANIAFNQTLCPVQATTQVNVVQTSPVAVAASPNNLLCQNDKLSLIANAGQAAFSYSWVGPANFGTSNQNPIINQVTPNNQGVYTVTAFFTNSIITCPTSATINISVVPVAAPIIAMPSNVCQNTTFTFNAVGGASVQSYAWVGPNSFTSTVFPQNPTITFNNVQTAASGIYYVTARYGIGITCLSTSSVQLNVIPVNTISVIPPTPVCQPNNANLQASATGANLYTWVGPNGFAIQGSNPTIYYPTPAASGIYTVTAFFGSGNVICSNTNTVSLTVYPVMHFSLEPLHTACTDGKVDIKGPVGATSYTWTSSNGFTANTKDISFPKIQPVDAGSYTLNISLGPCVTGATAQVIVYTPIEFTLFPQNRTVCSGDTTFLEVGVTGGTENPAFLWSPALFLDGPNGASKVCVPTGPMIYNVSAHDTRCPDRTISHTFSVNVNQPPKPNYHLDRVEGCAPFTASVVYDGPQENVFTVTYDFGGLKQIQKDSLENFKYVLNDPGTYTLYLNTLGTNTCAGRFRYPDEIIVNPRPGSSIITDPEVPTTIDEIKFIPVVKNGPAVSYRWAFVGGVPTQLDSSTIASIAAGFDTSTVENPVRKYENVGKYPVMLITQNEKGCIDTAFKALFVTDDMRLYIPNAFTPNGDGINDGFSVKGTGIKPEGFSMEISNRWGNIVFFTKDLYTPWDGKVNGKEAKDDVYIYRIRVVGMNNEGRREFIGKVSLIK